MKTYQKYYVGKGKQVKGLPIIKVTCTMDDLNALSYVFDGMIYVTFEVARMKNPDHFGREYTVYVTRREEAVNENFEAKAPENKPAKKSRKVKESIDEAPGLI